MKAAIDDYLAAKHALNVYLDPLTIISESCTTGDIHFMEKYEYDKIILNSLITKKHVMRYRAIGSAEMRLYTCVYRLCQKDNIIITRAIINPDKKLEKFVNAILEDLKILIIDLLCKHELLSVEDYLIYGDLITRATQQISINGPIEYKIYKEDAVEHIIADSTKKYIRYLLLLFAEIICKSLKWID